MGQVVMCGKEQRSLLEASVKGKSERSRGGGLSGLLFLFLFSLCILYAKNPRLYLNIGYLLNKVKPKNEAVSPH